MTVAVLVSSCTAQPRDGMRGGALSKKSDEKILNQFFLPTRQLGTRLAKIGVTVQSNCSVVTRFGRWRAFYEKKVYLSENSKLRRAHAAILAHAAPNERRR